MPPPVWLVKHTRLSNPTRHNLYSIPSFTIRGENCEWFCFSTVFWLSHIYMHILPLQMVPRNLLLISPSTVLKNVLGGSLATSAWGWILYNSVPASRLLVSCLLVRGTLPWPGTGSLWTAAWWWWSSSVWDTWCLSLDCCSMSRMIGVTFSSKIWR